MTMWWEKWIFAAKDKDKDKVKAPQETKEVSVVAKCIGCGQCADGCPLKVKIKVPVKNK